MLRRRGSAPGFSLAEVLVALAVVAVLAAVIAPAIASLVTRARIDGAAETLEGISDAIVTFHDDVGEYPQSMTQLVEPLVNGDQDICGNNYNGGERNRWAGPYWHRGIPAGGLPISIGSVNNNFFVLADPSGIDYMTPVVTNVTDDDATELDLKIDLGDGANAGTIRWQTAGGGLVSLGWIVPFPDC